MQNFESPNQAISDREMFFDSETQRAPLETPTIQFKRGSTENFYDKLPKSTIYFGTQENRKKNSQKSTNQVRTTKYLGAINLQSKGSMIGTFAAVLFFTMLKEAFEDYWRYQSDKELNNQQSLLYDPRRKCTDEVRWCHIKVGEVIKVMKDEPIPTDLLLIHAPKEVVFVSTVNLDGETNLKERTLAFDSISEKALKRFKGKIICDQPNSNLDYWNGNIYSEQLDRPYNCSIKNVLLRGCTLRNTEYCYGIVLYVGKETKIFLNAKKPKRKVSNLMKLMNIMLYTVFAFQVVIIITFASLSLKWTSDNQMYLEYFDLSTNISVVTWILQFFTFWVAYSHLIPISLYVIIEMLKLGQARLINKDVKMYCKEDGEFATCKNSDLIEELGQVEFIFSDKTGTLTQNKMEFKKCQINGIVYGQKSIGEKEQIGMCKSQVKYIQKVISDSRHMPIQEGKDLEQFFTFLALCHSVVVDRDPITQEISYQAASPDELALTLGAKQIGLEIMSRTPKTLVIKNLLNKQMNSYEINAEFPFDSDRKRMSMIVTHDGRHYLLTKGADNIMLPRLKHNQNIHDDKMFEKLNSDLYKFACESLRTLVMGQKFLNDEEFVEFIHRLQELKLSTDGNKEEKLNQFYDEMEQDLEYVGCSAIEDKLQDHVPQTIAKLIECDIRVWVLTGDKQETAIEIGRSCSLIQNDMEELILSSNSTTELQQKIEDQCDKRGLNRVLNFKNFEDVEKFRAKNQSQRLCIIINGATIEKLFKDDSLANKFFKLGLLASSVVCCRLQPKQKSDIVALAKKNGKWITLSIGDGANDVSMIQEAHIGVGIRGKEGTQAHRSADYAISQFKYLQRLLLIHGRLGYKRVSSMICYYFYKNIILVFTEIYFAFFNGYSGQIFFADWLPMLYNAVWTSWPCLFAYILEQDVNEHFVYRYPILYKAGQKGKYFSFGIFWRWIAVAIWHGFSLYFGVSYVLQFFLITLQTFQETTIAGHGRTYDHWFYSTIIFTLVVHIIVYKLFLDTIYWNWIIAITCLISFISYHVVVVIGNVDFVALNFQPQINGIYFLFMAQSKFWILFFTVPIMALFPDITYYFIQKVYFPTPTDIVLMKQKQEPYYRYSHPKAIQSSDTFKMNEALQESSDLKSEDLDEKKSPKPSFVVTINESDLQSQGLHAYVFPGFTKKEFGPCTLKVQEEQQEYRQDSFMEFSCASKKIEEFQKKKTGRVRTLISRIWSNKSLEKKSTI